MSIVWVIEDRPLSESLAAQLLGDFAVRAFRSIKTFGELARVRHRGRPHLVVVDLDSVKQDALTTNELIECAFPEVPRVFFVAEKSSAEGLQHTYQRPTQGIDVNAIIEGYLGSVAVAKQKSQRHVVFGSVTLDLDRQTLMLLGGYEESLSPKETQLLRLFMERPGQRVNRSMIQKSVWRGAVVSHRTVDSHISRLRKRVSNLGLEIENFYGGDFMLR